MAKIITFYNNKGGVSKTTTLFNLAVFLVKNGKKVLIADCDPQCNISELFFASDASASDPNEDLPGTSIYQALIPRFYGEVAKIDPDTVILTESKIYNNLFLLRGDFEFSKAEVYFSSALNLAITENIHEKNTYMALYNLLHDLGNKNSFDYILCDVGPSTGAITRMVVLCCDGYFVPLTPDRFSNQAVKVLGQVLKEWIKAHKEVSKTFEPFKIKCFPGNPTLYGAIMQNFKLSSDTKKIKEAYKKWQDKIKESMKISLLNGDLLISERLDNTQPFVAEILDVGPLAPISQLFGFAIFDVKQEHTKEASPGGQKYYGAVWKYWADKKIIYEAEIKKISEALS
jgi:cellulose biosynthesis protein BcsQ